ncbi:MAG: cupin domain-containing protein [Deferribacterales bacterium]
MSFIDTEKLEKEMFNGAKARFVHSDNMTMSLWRFEPGSELPEHSHPHEQMTKLINGVFELTVGDEVKVLTHSDVAMIPSGVSHKGRAITQCELLDVFYPVREDYR